jgi:hypothetical protein
MQGMYDVDMKGFMGKVSPEMAGISRLLHAIDPTDRGLRATWLACRLASEGPCGHKDCLSNIQASITAELIKLGRKGPIMHSYLLDRESGWAISRSIMDAGHAVLAPQAEA